MRAGFLRATLLCLIMSGCRVSGTGPSRYDPATVDLTPVTGGTFVSASIGDATFLNPILATDSASGEINRHVFNGLVKYDKDLVLVGELAERWEVKRGGKEITFYLKKGVKWHDGELFTASDVLFTYNTLIATTTRTAYASDYLMVERAEALDRHTFRVTYKTPFSPALESWGMGIIPRHIFEGHDVNTHPANRRPIGTGAYRFKEWIPAQKIELTANPDYFEGRPRIDRFVFRIIPDQSVQFLELRNGGLGMMGLTPDQYTAYDAFFTHYNKFRYPAFRYDYIGLNMKNPLFQDLRVRQAIAHAINKQDIIDGVYLGLAVPATGPFPPSSWAWNPDVPSPAYDPARSRALLAEAGWHPGRDGTLEKDGQPFRFTLITNQGNKLRESMAQIVQRALSEVGIRMEIRILEWSVFIHRYIDERLFDATLLGWNLARDPDAYAIWHSSQMEKKQYNFVSYKNAEVDRLLDLARQTFGAENRGPLYHRIHELIAKDLPYIFLVHGESLPVVHKKFIGVEEAPAGVGWNFNEWFVPVAWQGRHARSG